MALLQDIWSGLAQTFEGITRPAAPAMPEAEAPKEAAISASTNPLPLNTTPDDTTHVSQLQYMQDGSVRVGNIELPALVAKQLRDLGHPIETYSPGQLKEVLDACHFDCNLIDDDRAVVHNLSDRMDYDFREKQADLYDNDTDMFAYRSNAGRVMPMSSLPTPEAPAEPSWAERVGSAQPQPETYVARI
ncbi:MAG: hypothetical protein K2Q01_08950, partial [Rickettsiales bacterium]|nr:hypothetical protein [Rickettsiales bacterium]